MEIFKRPLAERDIEECFVFIAEDNLDNGLRFLISFEESLEQLQKFPLVGKETAFRDPRLNSVRVWHVKNHENYLIFYSLSNTRIEIIRVLHSTRNIDELFS
jgi:toxin ParE1/3/4